MAGHKLPPTIETANADSNFSTWLDAMLYKHHLTQKAFADEIGCDRKTINAIVNENRGPSLEFVVRCCAFFGLKAVNIPFDKKIWEVNNEDSM